MNDFLISVIVPVYNVEKYLDRCVESIVNQTYTNLEIILVDDGSPDNCPQMCDVWAEKDSRIKVIHKENGGLSSARNAGLDYMSGDYLFFLDSDDYINKDAISILFDLLQSNNCDMSFGRYVMVYEGQENTSANNCFSGEKIIFTEDEFWSYYYSVNHSENYSEKAVNMIISCNKLIKKSVFETLRFAVGRINEDEIIIHNIVSKCNKIAFIDKETYYYYQNENSIMGSKTDFYSKDSIYALGERVKYFAGRNKNYTPQAFEQFFYHCRWAYFDNRNTNSIFAKSIREQYKEVFNKSCHFIKCSANYSIFYAFYINPDIYRLVKYIRRVLNKFGASNEE